jgi:ubiquinol-cytochrome c reductase cytochrome b subunit
MARIEAEVGKPKGGFMKWIDDRFPFTATMKYHATEYYASKNFNVWYVFGVLAFVVLFMQLFTGIFLTMNYKPSAAEAFASVEYIMRDVEWGWLIRYLHSTGASFFFIIVYLHMFRAMLYGSYRKPRELIWIIGMLIFLVLMAEAFAGYLLPWGQMSYWGAQVIISLFGAIPWVGDALVEIIRGDYSISDITLNRFFALHVIALPLAKGADGVPLDGVAFHPYHTSKDLVAIIIFLMIFTSVVFFAPDMGGYFLEHANFEPANLTATPEHIAPVWYFTPFYAILRAVPDKLWGFILFGLSVMLPLFLPWLDRSRVKSVRYRGWIYKSALSTFVVTFLVLGWLGTMPAEPMYVLAARIFAVIYFAFFILMPYYTVIDKTKPVPERVVYHG